MALRLTLVSRRTRRAALACQLGRFAYLYHYTSRDTLYDIVRTCVLRPSHAQWGFGVYLTDIAPRADNRRRLSLLFGRGRFSAERLEAYVHIAREKADAEQHRDDPHVFVAPGKVSLSGEPIEIGLWQGASDPDDHGGWSSERIERCAPDPGELRRAFERLLKH